MDTQDEIDLLRAQIEYLENALENFEHDTLSLYPAFGRKDPKAWRGPVESIRDSFLAVLSAMDKRLEQEERELERDLEYEARHIREISSPGLSGRI